MTPTAEFFTLPVTRALLLPPSLWFTTDRVRIRRWGDCIIISPIPADAIEMDPPSAPPKVTAGEAEAAAREIDLRGHEPRPAGGTVVPFRARPRPPGPGPGLERLAA